MTSNEKPPQRLARSGGWIEKLLCGALLFGCLTITGVRPLIQETHDTARQPFAQISSELPEIGPLPTLWINWVIVGIFGLTMALRSQGWLKKPTSNRSLW